MIMWGINVIINEVAFELRQVSNYQICASKINKYVLLRELPIHRDKTGRCNAFQDKIRSLSL